MFRAAFPQYANLGDDFIKRNMERYAHDELRRIAGGSFLNLVKPNEPATILHFQTREQGRVWQARQYFILRRGYVFSIGLQAESQETLGDLTAQWFLQSLAFQ